MLAEEPRLHGRTGERATCDRGIDWAERRGRNVRNQIPDAAAVQTDSKLSGACYSLPEILLRCELLVEEEGHGQIIPVCSSVVVLPKPKPFVEHSRRHLLWFFGDMMYFRNVIELRE